ncbi:MAG: UvrD-helicase domain-containing protein, partial [Methanobacteriaceae archaeon]|nr:UvrD-helicase domain-containing protein [Methanobacteriaceae archaeon]
MMNWDEYQALVVSLLDRNIKDNREQHQAIQAPPSESQFLVAGPGSGKTTVMVLKILKYVLVDDIPPPSILATTFTKKAAFELKSRIMTWGNKIIASGPENPPMRNRHPPSDNLNLEEITIGTLDSISENLLKNPPVIEESVSRSLMVQKLFQEELEHHPDLISYLKSMKNHRGNLGVTGMSEVLLELKDRIYHDQVDLESFQEEAEHPGCRVACRLLVEYLDELKKRKLYDFTLLESELLKQIKKGQLDSFFNNIKIILVDEYQDTNLLQESIYFHMAQLAINNGGSLTVVGDDDQSLYRFRGATVDLFTQYQTRIKQKLNLKPQLINLSLNYRSTPSIVSFTNSFAELDEDYQYARVRNKPSLKSARKKGYTDYPVLGMFRPDRKTLARDLARFIIHGQGKNGYQAPEELIIKIKEKDCSLLMSSPLEFSSHSAKRFPHYLRQQLKKDGWEVFNPRGESLERVEFTELLAGLILEILDPNKTIENSMIRLPSKVKSSFHKWRKA